MEIDWKNYDPGEFYDEMISSPGNPRLASKSVAGYLQQLSAKQIGRRQNAADLSIAEMGVTFTVYSEGENIDRTWPFDIIPRIIPQKEWLHIEKGLIQRMTALNMFIHDLYNDQNIIKDGIVPKELIESSKSFLPQCIGVSPRYNVWAHICGSDLVRDGDGTVYVLEDNLRVPSGVSYMIENRTITKRVFPELFSKHRIQPVDDYPSHLFDMLASLSPRTIDHPEIVVMTPGIYNSAYFEHSYLAQQMGAELVEGSDLIVGDDDCVYMKTIDGLQRVDVIYRRVNDEFIDPEVFQEDSVLGVPGLMRAWRAGNVALANAPGAGVADDKVVYTYVPDIIKYYLDEDPIIPNVPSYRCEDKEQRDYVLANLDKLVVKPANESGGYGMLVGPHSTAAERTKFAKLIKQNPRNYIAQPTLNLSTAPTICGKNVEPRHLDLRPFILQSDRTYVTAGGLTRVALRKGSLVVNSSQGGGSKDTWIVDTGEK
ncbi:MAG: circularly permuted type 2 ATP-grasp protein [Cycloclasticus sp.]|nr:circularly permuted type 2 ATP-grasp protein [Cycloclasticus sp.]|tara:strand:+ start:88154 stop:89605 length:1452 start_codon:yes stop_codon:yes gene_type:complete